MTECEQKLVDVLISFDWKDQGEEEKKNVATLVSDAMNNLIFESKETLAHAIMSNPIGRMHMNNIVSTWLQVLHWQLKKRLYDKQNCYSVTISKNIVQHPDVISLIVNYGFVSSYDIEVAINTHSRVLDYDNIGEIIATSMATKHRTIQQSFSNFVFYVLFKYYRIRLDNDYSNDWYKCPIV